MEYSFFYITTKDKPEAQHIGRALVEERIAACVNIFDAIQSIYHWEGKICEDTETVLIAKTQKALSESLIKRVRELHSYSCPCIVELPIIAGFTDYLQWIERETTTPAQ
jgi:periplasmic divalent cation tolerance protein